MEKQCKGCDKYFKANNYLRHVASSKRCKNAFTKEEFTALKNEATEKAKLRKKEYRKRNQEDIKEKNRLYYLQNNERIKADRKKRYFIAKCEDEQNEEEEEEQKIFCKNCGKKFRCNVFLKHVAHSKPCKESHCEEEIIKLKEISFEKAKLRNLEYKSRNKETLQKKNQLYYLKNKERIKEAQNQIYAKKQCEKAMHDGDYLADSFYVQHSKCKNCHKKFKSKVFLKHLSHSKQCKDSYSAEEITDLKFEAFEKAKLRNFEYKLKNQEKMREKNKEYYMKNQEKRKAYKTEYYQKFKAYKKEFKIQEEERFRKEKIKTTILELIRSATKENLKCKDSITKRELEEISRIQSHGIDPNTDEQLIKIANSVEEKYIFNKNELDQISEAAETSANVILWQKCHELCNDLLLIWSRLATNIRKELAEIAQKLDFNLKCFFCSSKITCAKCKNEKESNK